MVLVMSVILYGGKGDLYLVSEHFLMLKHKNNSRQLSLTSIGRTLCS